MSLKWRTPSSSRWSHAKLLNVIKMENVRTFKAKMFAHLSPLWCTTFLQNITSRSQITIQQYKKASKNVITRSSHGYLALKKKHKKTHNHQLFIMYHFTTEYKHMISNHLLFANDKWQTNPGNGMKMDTVRVRVTRSLVLCVCFVDCCLSFFFWPLCCLFFFDIRILIKLWYLQTLLDNKNNIYIYMICISQIIWHASVRLYIVMK